MKKRILITGGSGFIGTNLIDFYNENYEIVNIDINPPRNKSQMKFWKNVDIMNKSELIQNFISFDPNYVFHMAARTDLNGSNINDYEANTTGLKNVIEAIKNCRSIEKVVFASSRLVCKIGYEPINEYDYNPSTVYGESKILGEKIVRESELDQKWIMVRPTSLWGPWFDVPYKNFFDSIFKGYYLHPHGKQIFKKFGYVGNSVFIMNTLLFNDSLDNKTIYLSDFDMLNVKDWATIISSNFEKGNIKQVPILFLRVCAWIGDFIKIIGVKNPPITNFRLNNLLTNMYYDTDQVKKVVGDLPFSLAEGTRKTCDWYKLNKDVSGSK